MANEDISKLPKWAQQRIEVLERNLEHERSRVNTQYDPETSKVLLDPYGEPPIALKDNAMFELYPNGRNKKERRDEYVQIRIESYEPGIEVVMVRTGGHMRIIPQASNSIMIDPRDQRFVKGRYVDRT